MADARSMSEVPDASVNLVVTSPPYFNIKDYGLDGHQKTRHSKNSSSQIGDITQFDKFIDSLLEIWTECFRVLAPNAKIVINAPLLPMVKRDFSTHENRHIFDLNAAIQQSILANMDELFLLDTYIWNRTNPSKKLMFGSYPVPTNFYAQNTCEFVSVYVKAGKRAPVDKGTREASSLSQSEWVTYTRQVWDLPVPSKADSAFGKHAAIMPAEMAQRCIRLYSFVDDVVLDPFSGSGTTLKAARDLGRRFIGYELVDSYAAVIDEKLGASVCVKPSESTGRALARAKRGAVPAERRAISEKYRNKILKLDAEALAGNLGEFSVDAAIVDPPYNLGKADWDTWSSDEAFQEFTHSWLSAVYKTLVPGGAFCIFNTPRNASWILSYLEELGAELQNWLTWDKRDGFSATTRRFVPMQETILYVTKPGNRHTFNADAIRIPYQSSERIAAAARTGILKNGKRWFPNPLGRMPSDVWHISSERHVNKRHGRVIKATHPTIKPEELIQRLVLATTNPGDTILDCFVGTGTTAVVAFRNNRSFVACDTDAESVRLARVRLSRVRDIEAEAA